MRLPPTRTQVELIEVVRITDPTRHLTSRELTGDAVAVWEGEQVRQTMTLLAGLPDSELYRCFFPGWGIRAHGPTEPLFEIAFCFRCHGARLWGADLPPDLETRQTFDADSPLAAELLSLFRSSTAEGPR